MWNALRRALGTRFRMERATGAGVPPVAAASTGPEDGRVRLLPVGGRRAGLRLQPEHPVAGRDIVFTLQGLEPWAEVAIELTDPRGRRAEWVSVDGTTFSGESGPETRHTDYADEAGSFSWTRPATPASDGQWTVTIAAGGREDSARFSIVREPPDGQDVRIGPVTLYRGGGPATPAPAYYSAGVPPALVADLQKHLAWLERQLREGFGVERSQTPAIHLAEDRGLLDDLSRVAGQGIGFEGGYYRPFPPFPGIYLRTDFSRPAVFRLLAHEYAHAVLMDAARGHAVPAWLNEGAAAYYEHELACRGPYPEEGRRQLFTSAALAREALAQHALPALSSLEGPGDWAAQRQDERVRLHYAVAHMAARFLCEAYGEGALLDLARTLCSEQRTEEALRRVCGGGYTELQEQFTAWLAAWEHPERRQAREYLSMLAQVMDEESGIGARRSAIREGGAVEPHGRAAWRNLVRDAQELRAWVAAARPPQALGRLHETARGYVSRLVEWLTLEMDYARSGSEGRRSSANALVPEMKARANILARRTAIARSIYQL